MPAAAGDGLLGEPAAGGGGAGADAARGASCLPAWVSGVPRERLRDFQHHKRVGPYLVGSRKLGEGSFAKVREGLHVLTGEKVAIKVIDKKRARKDTYVTKNLRREGQIQQMIRHPNITQLLDILETENSYYLVMELCPGGNLMHRIYEKKRLEEAEARRYIRQLVSAVEHLHRAGVVHRDLKIENLLLDEDNNIKLIDFGLSNCAGILGHSDPFSTQCGSPAYAAPELLARKKYGPKIDVWSIGVNMYAMLTGTLPFTVEPFSLRALYQKMVDKEMNPLPTQLSTGNAPLPTAGLRRGAGRGASDGRGLGSARGDKGFPGLRVPCVTYPNRISLADLSPSVVLHMTQKLGYKNSDVINTVLANRACHILAVYFLLNKKLERYVGPAGKSDVPDGVCSKAPLCPGDRCRPGREPCEDRKPKEQERKGDFLPRPFPKKLEQHLPAPRPPPATLATQLQSTRALLRDRRARPGPPDRDSFSCRSIFRKTSDPSCVASSSMEFIPGPPPRTPRIVKKPEPPLQGPGGSSVAPREEPLVPDMVRSFESVYADRHSVRVAVRHIGIGGAIGSAIPGLGTRRPIPNPQNSPPPPGEQLHSTPASWTQHGARGSPVKEESVWVQKGGSPVWMQEGGSPEGVRSRGRGVRCGAGPSPQKRHHTQRPSVGAEAGGRGVPPAPPPPLSLLPQDAL
ncbi:hypothetical protein QTO34_014946 [Cnephaeus nilssonii]|uniref:Hormonally up-regulated neu tumor-associated kinase n=1 Tax=Cnephaeus nilssonii TaxID=3371016 RepID=A0AA40I7G4_CNENI|nr:hypothetical protein QTO34_014946 [Eptesicus nilssonii]